MSDYDFLLAVRLDAPVGTSEHKRESLFASALKEIWRLRAVEYIRAHGRTLPCDCMLYQPGDYEMAFRAAQTKQRVD